MDKSFHNFYPSMTTSLHLYPQFLGRLQKWSFFVVKKAAEPNLIFYFTKNFALILVCNSWSVCHSLQVNITDFLDLINLKFFYGAELDFSIQEMKWSKQKMELFYLLPGLWSKDILYIIFFCIFFKKFKIDFQNRKLNDLNMKWNYFTQLWPLIEKLFITKCCSFSTRCSKLIFKTGNGIN